MMKRMIALLGAAVMLFTVCGALAETRNGIDLSQVPEFLFRHYKDGIGCGVCHVFTAPSANAYRVGRATCDTDSDVYVAGRDASGWIMVRYTTNNKTERVGYIPRSKVGSFTAKNNLGFSYITCEAAAEIAITDNPMSRNDDFAVIPQGGVFAILAKYTYHGDWWYVETKVDGLYARGFISRDTELVPTDRTVIDIPELSTFPQASPEGDALQGTVTVIGDQCLVRAKADTASKWVARAASYNVFPFYGTKIGTNRHPWYRVCVDGTWGWIAGPLVREN